MKRLLHKFVLYWIVAAAAHLPIPVWDGDNVGSHGDDGQVQRFDPSGVSDDVFDIDMVLLGCDQPDDPDDGPFDDDPERDDPCSGTFPVYLPSKLVKAPWRKVDLFYPSQLGGGLVVNACVFPDRLHAARLSRVADRIELSSDSVALKATTVMRC